MAELNELTINGSNYTFEDDVARELATTEESRAQAAEQTLDGKIGQNTQAIANEKSRAEGAEGALQQLIQQVNASLTNYYLKSETYSKTEVNTIIDNVKQFRYQVAETLPTASADTMGIIYLIPSAIPKTQNIKEEYLTILDGSTYKWEHIGDTNIDLSGYSTTEQMNAAIASALASYYTKSEVDEALGGKQNTIDDLTDIRSGAQAGSTAVQPSTLNDVVKNTVAESGVYDVSANNDNTKFESLSALLSSANLNTLIPTDIRKGGMSIKFVLSSDNKYVQYRLMNTAWSNVVTDWQGVDAEPTADSDNLVKSGGVYKEIINIIKFPETGIPSSGSWPNFHLNANGIFVADDNAVVYSYIVTAGDLIYLKLSKDTEGVYQFQKAQTAPTSGTNVNLVGQTVTVATDAFVTVPQGATRLYVSKLKTNTTNEVKNTKSYSFEEIYNRESTLENRANYMPISANEFIVAANTAHSSNLDVISVKISTGQQYYIITNGIIYAKYVDGTNAQINAVGTAAKDINGIGIYFNNTTASAVRIYAIILTRGEYLYNFLKADEKGGVSEWGKNYWYSKNKAYTIYKELDNNLKLGSLQASLVTNDDAHCVGYCKKIPVNGAKKITIAPLPLYSGITAYRYRFIQYKDDGTYNQLAATADTTEPYTFTILDGYTSFAIGINARNGVNAASVNLYNLIDQAINLYYEDTPLSAFAGFEDIPQLINQVLEGQKTYDAIEFNPDVVDKLNQAQRTINRYGDEYLHLPKPLTLLHFSDLHADGTELKRLIEFNKYYSEFISDMICTGDLVYDRWSNDFNFWGNTQGAEDVLIAIGNHDVLTDPSGYDWSQRATQAQQYNRYIAPFVENWGVTIDEGNTYYYKDYGDNKIRLIVLNVMLTGADNTAQLSWLEDVLADALTNELNVVIANHYPIADSQEIPSNFTSLDKPITQTDVLTSEYTGKVLDFISDGGKFICYIAGHTHRDYLIKDAENANQLCAVIDAASVRNGNMASDTQRTIGERSQDLANLITFDVSSKVIKIIRVGANIDHYVRNKNCITINYETGDIITQW